MRVIAGFLVAVSLWLGSGVQAASTFEESDAQPDTETSVGASDQYPRVTALETALLGQTFPGEELSVRLSRMETKVFGSASQSVDLGDRTDKLQQYAEQKLNKKIFQPAPGYQSEDAVDEPTPSDQSDYPRIVALEQAILGRSFVGEPPAERLSRLEVTALGKASDSDDLSLRVETLERYAEKKLHKKLTPQQSSQGSSTAGSQGSQLPRQLLSILGGALLGVNGLGNIGTAVQQAPPQEQQVAKPREDDALVKAPDPPPATARLITKVGWCETQVFGRTFPEMHLADRLDQLNRQIAFKPGKSGVQLMDDIGSLVQIVQYKVKGRQSVGAANQLTVH